jgi:serine/threonine protein kinase
MDLLKLMLEKEPDKRIGSQDALSHPAFQNVLSKSPLINRGGHFDPSSLILATKMVMEWANQQKLEEPGFAEASSREHP